LADREVRPAIVAGAGTGKTTRIIGIVADALLERGLEPTRLLALTFTVKAANEMRERLAGELEKRGAPAEARSIDRMEIGTIHSFAAHILRQFPLEAGVSPGFQEEEGGAIDALFRERWPPWIRGLAVPFLDRIDPADLRELARFLCEHGVPSEIPSDPGFEALLQRFAEDARALLLRYEGVEQSENRRCLRELREMEAVFAGRGDRKRRAALKQAKGRPGELKRTGWPGWPKEDWAALLDLRRRAMTVLDTDDALAARVVAFLRPFAEDFREECVRRGFISFQGLLVGAASLLRDNREVRAHFKERFRLVVVDEFQDTDPLQGELLLYVSEKRNAFARTWRDVEIEPGKLVIVGDPKQSIYMFRGADLEAYQAISDKLTGGADSAVERLATNYRSRPELVGYVNEVCARIMSRPAYEPILPAPNAPVGGRVEAIVFPGVGADEAREREGRAIADWILAEALRWGEVAILLRSLSGADHYTTALRSRGIDYAIEGEKSFWRAPEVIDLLNLLTASVRPSHEPAVIGLLRSVLGAIRDVDLLALRRAAALSPIDADRVPPDLPHVRELFQGVRDLHRRCRREEPAAIVHAALGRFPLREIWAASARGEQAVANIDKAVEVLTGGSRRSLDAALREGRRRSIEAEDESESPVADEGLDAVRIMSIHKAKGLEFPVVVLADLHREPPEGRLGEPLLREWLTGRVGLAAGSVRSTGRLMLEEQRLVRQKEERVRLLYVALTRARDRLLLTGGAPSPANPLDDLLWPACVERRDPPPPATAAPRRAAPAEPDPEEERRLWDRRAARAREEAERTPLRTPTTEEAEAHDDDPEPDPGRPGGRELGVTCHEILAQIDLANPGRIEGDAGSLVNPFLASEAFREIATADEVHREVDFVARIEGEVWSGRIDVLYRRGSRWTVVDYKTGRRKGRSAFETQERIYRIAVQRALGLDSPPRFRIVHLAPARRAAGRGLAPRGPRATIRR
jgi:ATP-dependent helicase/nuclease subunit A